MRLHPSAAATQCHDRVRVVVSLSNQSFVTATKALAPAVPNDRDPLSLLWRLEGVPRQQLCSLVAGGKSHQLAGRWRCRVGDGCANSSLRARGPAVTKGHGKERAVLTLSQAALGTQCWSRRRGRRLGWDEGKLGRKALAWIACLPRDSASTRPAWPRLRIWLSHGSGRGTASPRLLLLPGLGTILLMAVCGPSRQWQGRCHRCCFRFCHQGVAVQQVRPALSCRPVLLHVAVLGCSLLLFGTAACHLPRLFWACINGSTLVSATWLRGLLGVPSRLAPRGTVLGRCLRLGP
mmetsp:Transcript_83542/g.236817  ORF Transcript_83542/g.236817 Transcript_83542/m.236817 type:complete len:292 (+) Transcript_83542:149-1024(+)